ncbi:Rad52/Rad22 family DNA repair protein [Streptomyces sp. NPDC050504]|uniref:Rad52/Rad22 family DNA repair protein n=1 Tax=Streptomyces sp. NPDC050504 TaxID=3365618 RepID=UPI0037AA94B2
MTVNATPGTLTEQQTQVLLGPISPKRVRNLRGMSHLEAWDVRRQLIRVFGFDGFTIETQALELVAERESRTGERSRWTVVYRAQVRLTLKAVDGQPLTVFEDAAAGDAVNQPSLGDAHDLAMKTALSQALKRCAVNLGDQFGLSLYNDGSQGAVVLRSLAYMGAPVADSEDSEVRPEPTPATPTPVPQQAGTPPQADPPRPGAAPLAGPAERQAALDAMWEAARAVGFTDGLPVQFQQSFGHPIEQGTPAEFRQARELMVGGAAA